MQKLILPFLNPSLFQCGDKPTVWRDALPNPTQYVNWDTVTHCFNNPWYYRTQVLNFEGRRLMLPEKFEVWYEKGVHTSMNCSKQSMKDTHSSLNSMDTIIQQ